MKLLKKIAVFALAGITVLGYAGCNSWTTGTGGDGPNIDQEDVSDRSGWVLREREAVSSFTDKELRITYFNGGYGGAWLEAMETAFEQDYPGLKVTLTPSDDINSTLETDLKSAPDDIYISQDIAWEYLGAGEGLLANLDELYASTIYKDTKQNNLSIKFSDLLTKASLESSYYETSKASGFFKISQIQGAGGIMYNKTMFDANGWTIPETYEELAALCETIATSGAKNEQGNKIAPFLVAGTEGYLWDSMVYDWWMQIAGEEEYLRLYKGDDKNCWNPTQYPYQKQAYKYWYDLFVVNKDKYLARGFEGVSHTNANMLFLNNAAAMMPATAWSLNELGQDILAEMGIDVGLIPTPYVKEAKKDKDGNPLRVCYDVAGRDSIVVAEKGNKALAVEFLKWMSETENALLFPENVSGVLMGFKYDVNYILENEKKYCKYQWDKDMFTLLGTTDFRHTGYSANPMFVQKLVSPYPHENRYLECFGGTYNPNKLFDAAWSDVNANWDTWRNEAGLV